MIRGTKGRSQGQVKVSKGKVAIRQIECVSYHLGSFISVPGAQSTLGSKRHRSLICDDHTTSAG